MVKDQNCNIMARFICNNFTGRRLGFGYNNVNLRLGNFEHRIFIEEKFQVWRETRFELLIFKLYRNYPISMLTMACQALQYR